MKEPNMYGIEVEILIKGGCGFLGRALVGHVLKHTQWAVRLLALPHEVAPSQWGARVRHQPKCGRLRRDGLQHRFSSRSLDGTGHRSATPVGPGQAVMSLDEF